MFFAVHFDFSPFSAPAWNGLTECVLRADETSVHIEQVRVPSLSEHRDRAGGSPAGLARDDQFRVAGEGRLHHLQEVFVRSHSARPAQRNRHVYPSGNVSIGELFHGPHVYERDVLVQQLLSFIGGDL